MFASPSTPSSSKSKHFWRLPAFISLVLMILLLVWDFSGGDMKMAALWGETTGFPLRTNWWMVKVMHEGARTLGWFFLLAMLIGIWRPWGGLWRPQKGPFSFCPWCAHCCLSSSLKVLATPAALGTYRTLAVRHLMFHIGIFGNAMAQVVIASPRVMPPLGLHSWPPTLGSSKTTRQLRALGYWAPCRLVLCWAFHSKYGVLTL